MALPISKILNYQFMSLEGQIIPPGHMLSIDQRGGVDGTEITSEGKKGTPFTLISRVDCASYIDGQFLFKLYKDGFVNDAVGPVQVVQSDYDTVSFGYRCQVLDVRLLSCQRSPVIVGGLQYASGAILECEWTLLAIAD